MLHLATMMWHDVAFLLPIRYSMFTVGDDVTLLATESSQFQRLNLFTYCKNVISSSIKSKQPVAIFLHEAVRPSRTKVVLPLKESCHLCISSTTSAGPFF